MKYTARPFTAAVARVRDNGATYEDLATRSGRARSQKWFWDLLNGDDPWVVLPPGRDQFARMCMLLGATPDILKAWIATEWYSIREDRHSSETLDIASKFASLDEPNKKVLKELVQRMWIAQINEQICDIEAAVRQINQGHDSA